ncbi:MAG: hypothetical protein MUF83_09315 [Acidimicrobiales bacterium]|nr:hypothetical protein [Acidimicrobiales bacterium]
MARYRLDPTRCSVGVSPRPALAPTPVRASLLDGVVDVDGLDGGRASGEGTFRVEVRGLPETLPLLGRAELPWGHTTVELAGQVTSVERRHEGFHVLLRVDLGGRAVPLGASVRQARRTERGELDVVGRTIVDPRAFGLALPPLVNLVVHVSWRALLAPEPDEPRPEGRP